MHPRCSAVHAAEKCDRKAIREAGREIHHCWAVGLMTQKSSLRNINFLMPAGKVQIFLRCLSQTISPSTATSQAFSGKSCLYAYANAVMNGVCV